MRNYRDFREDLEELNKETRKKIDCLYEDLEDGLMSTAEFLRSMSIFNNEYRKEEMEIIYG